MPPRPVPGLAGVNPYKGGDSKIPGLAKAVKLASNENPLGPSPKALKAYAGAAGRLHLYPDGAADALRTAIAAKYDLDRNRIVCGAGSDELFQLVARAFLEPGDDIVQSEYAFLVYRLVAQQCGADVRSAKDKDFTVDVDAMLDLVGPRTKIVFLANPNNPTGTYVPADAVRRLHAGLPEHVLLVIDAAYAEFVDAPDYDAGTALAAQHDNVLLTRTFSKIYGLAALRLGWGFGSPIAVDAINRVRGPFNISIPAHDAGIEALADDDFLVASQTHNARELARVAGVLTQLGYRLTPSVCNFVLIHFGDAPGRTADDADAFLRSRGFIARKLNAYGLPNALRLSIGATHENDGVLEVLTDFARAA